MKAEDWIKVEDRLPTNEEDVLVYDKVQGLLQAWLETDCWVSYECGMLEHVTHWTPIVLPDKD